MSDSKFTALTIVLIFSIGALAGSQLENIDWKRNVMENYIAAPDVNALLESARMERRGLPHCDALPNMYFTSASPVCDPTPSFIGTCGTKDNQELCDKILTNIKEIVENLCVRSQQRGIDNQWACHFYSSMETKDTVPYDKCWWSREHPECLRQEKK